MFRRPNTTAPEPAAPPAAAPLRLRWTLDELISSDQHRLIVTFAATVQPLPDPAERQLFEETFHPPASGSPDPSAIVRHFAPALRAAAADFAAGRTGAAATAADARSHWLDMLRSAAKPLAFACGVDLLAPFALEVSSPTLQQEQMEQTQRALSERQSAGRLKHLQQAGDLLKQWEQLRSTLPSLTPGQLLQQMAPADRGGMLEALLVASSSAGASGNVRVTPLWAVAGPALLRVEPVPPDAPSSDPKVAVISLPTQVGPLRSVCSVDNTLLIGGQRGAMLTSVDDPAAAHSYFDPDLRSDFGFSRVVLTGERIWAVHREGGIVAWQRDQRDRPQLVHRPDAQLPAPRHLIALPDLSVLVAVEDRLLRLDNLGAAEPAAQLPAPIVALHMLDGKLVVVCEDGAVSLFDATSIQPLTRFQPTGRVNAAAVLPWLSSARLLLATSDGPIVSIGLDDQLVMNYTAPAATGARAVAAASGRVAAMSTDRQRLILWNAWDGRQPAAEVQISPIVRHRLADIAFGSG